MSSSPQSTQDLARLLKVIADETRLQILGAIAREPLTGKDLAERLELSPPTISHHMRKLTDAGIVISSSDAQRQWYRLNSELLHATRKTALVEKTTPQGSPTDEEATFRAKVIRDFFEGDRLKAIPAQRKKRVVVLQYLVHRFDADRTYTEQEVNEHLKPAHDDVATLRRELVDYGFMERDRNIYQITRGAPARSRQVQQEITGDESAWISALLSRAISITPEVEPENDL